MIPHKLRLALLVPVLLHASAAGALDLVAPGIAAKLASGAGQTVSRGPSALFSNPANLIFSKFVEPYVDVGYANLSYTYQNIDEETYDPVAVKASGPPITAGLGLRFAPSFALGAAIVPTGIGALNAVNVPMKMTKDKKTAYQLVDIANTQSGMKIAAGAAFRIDYVFSLGAGVIINQEKNTTVITPVDAEGVEADEPYIDAAYQGSFNQYIGGIRSELFDRMFVLALSYKTGGPKVYLGDILINDSPEADYEDIEATGYLPGAIGFGAETRFGDFGIFVDYVRELWAPARAVVSPGYGEEFDEYDYLDTNNIAGGIKFWLFPKHMLELSFASYGANIGDGTVPETEEAAGLTAKKQKDRFKHSAAYRAAHVALQGEEEEADPVIGGPAFGDVNAISRLTFGGGYRAKIQGAGYFILGGQYSTGKRAVPEGATGEGNYTLSVMAFSAGIAYGF